MAINPADIKVGFTKVEIDGYVDSLKRIRDAVSPYQQLMFVGGPMPGQVIDALIKGFDERCKDATAKGPLSPREAA